MLDPRPSPTELAHARAAQLVERYGILTREAALGEGTEGGFAGVYPVLRALEEKGRVRRGYFVAGLGAAQFALPGAVDRLRSARPTVAWADPDDGLPDEAAGWPGATASASASTGGGRPSPAGSQPLTVLAATDPAQPYGAALPWPETGGRPARAAGALVVLGDGEPVAFVERGGRSLWTFPAASAFPRWPQALGERVASGDVRSHEVTTVDGEPVRTGPWADALRAAGYADGYRGLVARGRGA